MKWIITLFAGVVVGVLAVFYFLSRVPLEPKPAVVPPPPPLPSVIVLPGTPDGSAATSTLPALTAPPEAAAAPAVSTTMPVGALLAVPLAGLAPAALSDTFEQPRGTAKRHEALDIVAPAGTPVYAVADGKVAKLFTSEPGGITLYQFDTSEKLAYYYAHLQGYAKGVSEGMTVKRGELIGYVGASGNADPATPHLHFAVFQLGPEKQWWKGTPVNPYPMFQGIAPK